MTNHIETKELYFIRTSIDSLTITYRLCEHKTHSSDNLKYSLLVSVDDCVNIEEKFVPFISDSRSEAEQILEILCKGYVTPCTLSDILEDIMR